MENSIPWYQSPIYVNAIVAVVMQLGVIFGVAGHFTEADVSKYVNAVMQVIALGSSIWIWIARHRSTLQPITLTKKTEE